MSFLFNLGLPLSIALDDTLPTITPSLRTCTVMSSYGKASGGTTCYSSLTHILSAEVNLNPSGTILQLRNSSILFLLPGHQLSFFKWAPQICQMVLPQPASKPVFSSLLSQVHFFFPSLVPQPFFFLYLRKPCNVILIKLILCKSPSIHYKQKTT